MWDPEKMLCDIIVILDERFPSKYLEIAILTFDRNYDTSLFLLDNVECFKDPIYINVAVIKGNLRCPTSSLMSRGLVIDIDTKTMY